MRRVMLYSLLLVAGMGLSQLAFFQELSAAISALTMIFLAYIMIEVGMEFDIDKSRLGSYAVDYGIAMGAAAVPWLCAALYFWWWFGLGFKESLLVGRFASPTSAGILFTMLAAAGLAASWLYKKAGNLRLRPRHRPAPGSFGAGICARLRNQIRSSARLGGVCGCAPRCRESTA